MSKRYDVAVVGLGAMGAATLFQLARMGVRAVGIDRHAPPHTMGSTHGETRVTRLAIGEGDAYVPFAMRSHEIWRALEAETGEDLFDQCGYVMIAPPGLKTRHHGASDFLGHTISIARRHGIAHEVLDAAGLHAKVPAMTPAPGELAYYEPSGGMVRPEACVAVQLRLAMAGGAEVMTDTVVQSIAEHGRGVVIETDAGTVEADQVVVSAGAWIGKLLGGPYRATLVPYRQVFHWYPSTAPALHGPDRMPVYIWVHGEGRHDYFYGFPALPGATALKTGIEQDTVTCDPDTVDRAIDPADGPAVYAGHVAGRIAGLSATPERSSVCLYTITPDSGFVIERHATQPRIAVVSPCSGHGFKHSPALGEAIAQWVVRGESTLSLAPFGSGRLSAAA